MKSPHAPQNDGKQPDLSSTATSTTLATDKENTNSNIERANTNAMRVRDRAATNTTPSTAQPAVAIMAADGRGLSDRRSKPEQGSVAAAAGSATPDGYHTPELCSRKRRCTYEEVYKELCRNFKRRALPMADPEDEPPVLVLPTSLVRAQHEFGINDVYIWEHQRGG